MGKPTEVRAFRKRHGRGNYILYVGRTVIGKEDNLSAALTQLEAFMELFLAFLYFRSRFSEVNGNLLSAKRRKQIGKQRLENELGYISREISDIKEDLDSILGSNDFAETWWIGDLVRNLHERFSAIFSAGR